MRGEGRIVQTGTPEEIVLHPADGYVADFVAGISRLKVVRAHAVMQPRRHTSACMAPSPAISPASTRTRSWTY